jgi:hypothetical protein
MSRHHVTSQLQAREGRAREREGGREKEVSEKKEVFEQLAREARERECAEERKGGREGEREGALKFLASGDDSLPSTPRSVPASPREGVGREGEDEQAEKYERIVERIGGGGTGGKVGGAGDVGRRGESPSAMESGRGEGERERGRVRDVSPPPMRMSGEAWKDEGFEEAAKRDLLLSKETYYGGGEEAPAESRDGGKGGRPASKPLEEAQNWRETLGTLLSEVRGREKMIICMDVCVCVFVCVCVCV